MAGKRGLGSTSMSPEKRRAITSAGGKASQASGRANRFTSETASAAGRIGGSRRKITAVWCVGCGLMIPTKQPHDCQPCTLLAN